MLTLGAHGEMRCCWYRRRDHSTDILDDVVNGGIQWVEGFWGGWVVWCEQLVVEKMLTAQGIKRTELGREAFVEKVWEWKEKYGGTITNQMRRLGASCDWSREHFTLDDQLSGPILILAFASDASTFNPSRNSVVCMCLNYRRGVGGFRSLARERPHLSW